MLRRLDPVGSFVLAFRMLQALLQPDDSCVEVRLLFIASKTLTNILPDMRVAPVCIANHSGRVRRLQPPGVSEAGTLENDVGATQAARTGGYRWHGQMLFLTKS
jgi:hypothetical protein